MNPDESQLHYPFGEQLPAPGTTLEVAPGVRWLRMALPFALDHINLWLLRDRDAETGREGWTIVDCGIANEETRANWEAIFGSGALEGLLLASGGPALYRALAEGWADAVVVVDADSEASANLLEACAARLAHGAADAAQAVGEVLFIASGLCSRWRRGAGPARQRAGASNGNRARAVS